jgi:hypothetical protein
VPVPDDQYSVYDFDPERSFKIRQSAIEGAEADLALQIEIADETGKDLNGVSFCGCDICCSRVHAGFWIAWTLSALESGDLEVLPGSVPA